jgi:hypothetical protein
MAEGPLQSRDCLAPGGAIGCLAVFEPVAVEGPRSQLQIERMMGFRIDNEPYRRADVFAPRHHGLAIPCRRPVVELADEDEGRNRHGAHMAQAKRIVGYGGAKAPVEQPLDSVECDSRQRHGRALRVSDDGDAFGIDERQGRQAEQRAIGVHHEIDGRSTASAAVVDLARAEAVDGEQRIAQRRIAGRVGPFDV